MVIDQSRVLLANDPVESIVARRGWIGIFERTGASFPWTLSDDGFLRSFYLYSHVSFSSRVIFQRSIKFSIVNNYMLQVLFACLPEKPESILQNYKISESLQYLVNECQHCPEQILPDENCL